MRLFPDVEPALIQLREAGYRLGMITNVDSDPAEELERLGLKQRFDAVIASCGVGFEKPNPHIFQEALRVLKVSPDEAVHVGDLYLADVQGAGSVGIKGILLDRFDLQEGRHSLRIRSLTELAPLLRNGIL